MTRSLFSPTSEHELLRKTVVDFSKFHIEPSAMSRDRRESFNPDLLVMMGELGLLGITSSPDFDGSGMDAISAVIAHEEMAYSDPGLTLSYLAHAMLCVNNLSHNASEDQKRRWLPKLCSGEWIGAMAMSESGIGTDVLAMSATAEKTPDGYQLNGQKMWITNGAKNDAGDPADIVFVYAKTGEKDGRPQISSFVVEAGTSGYSVGQIIKDKCGMRGSITAELVFDNCVIPASNLVGEEGQSIIHMMRNLEIERLTLAAISLGIAKRSLEVMLNYANERKAFKHPLTYFGQIQHQIANSYAEYQAARSYVYRVAGEMDLEKPGQRLDSDGAKLFTAKIAKGIADRAIQVLGGNGYIGEYVVERLWRDAKLLEIGGGTNESHEKNMTKDLSRMLK